MKKQYLPEQFEAGSIYKITYKQLNGEVTKRTIAVAEVDYTNGRIVCVCLLRCAFRRLNVSGIIKAKNITSRLKG